MTQSDCPQVQLTLAGQLTESALAAALNRADLQVRAAKSLVALVVDCSTMTGYDPPARSLFVSWNSRHKRKLLCVAIVTQNRLWHMVISSMSLASGQKMKAFATVADTQSWISQEWSRHV
jgi:hypothetical protein